MKLIYLKSLKCDSFDVTIDTKILFFRVSVTIESGHSLLQFATTNCLIRPPNFIVLAYLEVPKLAKPGPTDRQTDRMCDLYMSLGTYIVP